VLPDDSGIFLVCSSASCTHGEVMPDEKFYSINN
jgi:hypothetical protein